MLAERWWFWALAAAVIATVVVAEPRWRGGTAAVRARALRGRLVAEPGGRVVDSGTGPRWSETWLPGLLVGAWVCGSPWIWGYDDVGGAIVADVVTGSAIALVSVAGVAFPALLTLNLVAGLWLVTAPWLVGFGTHGGPVGLSDVGAGVLVCGISLHGLRLAAGRVGAARQGPIGRVPRRPP